MMRAFPLSTYFIHVRLPDRTGFPPAKIRSGNSNSTLIKKLAGHNYHSRRVQAYTSELPFNSASNIGLLQERRAAPALDLVVRPSISIGVVGSVNAPDHCPRFNQTVRALQLQSLIQRDASALGRAARRLKSLALMSMILFLAPGAMISSC